MDLARRRLKAWVVFGVACEDQTSHRIGCWAMVRQLRGDLPSEPELNALAPKSWEGNITPETLDVGEVTVVAHASSDGGQQMMSKTMNTMPSSSIEDMM